ncbi:tRNA glutamyl-Q(34) synthetase GluQRS [Luteolibacter luteus]|uniref:tRNA glutamyl-Q(34) synthetase GluQRS n=1 Tax=Luteolibacter luteus TaxID=2728835 RepID=A0A858RRR6_9BACT|nr:tRNA glutamyl-Q(34) synthetase GluQRS [Luteolibacter luteus]QJE98633.1 tRNA glutamyl-Q(34) synthetase GluQRS [Luteolibacter luteus]
MPEIVTRFAPSPTGYLHLGHVHAAKVAHDLARQDGGRFLLRFEDIDHTRTRPEYYDAMEEDLRWLGLAWDGAALRQSSRTAAYDAVLERLKEIGAVYPCFCTRREIEEEVARITNAPHGPEGALYPGTCRRLPLADREARIANGIQPAWRLDVSFAAGLTGPLSFHDLQHGRHHVDPGLLGDVVLARKDIGTSYHLAVTTDDAFQDVTHVTRGEDLLLATHVHRLLQALLGFPEPLYLHHSLVLDGNGVRLAKRNEALSIRHLKAAGNTPQTILAMLPLS